MKILFTYLVAFSGNGGIERFNRCFIKALYSILGSQSKNLAVVSLYDVNSNQNHTNEFKGFGKNKWVYFIYIIYQSLFYDLIILGHVNLSIIGFLIKLVAPNKKFVLITHGIEVWGKLSYVQRKFIHKVDYILAVSNFTKNTIAKNHQINSDIITVFPNTLDPKFDLPFQFNKPVHLTQKHQIGLSTKVLLTVSRMSSYEKYKGYECVIKSLPFIDPSLDYKYLLVGKCDDMEFKNMKTLAKKLNVESKVIFVGYINDEELLNYYLLADVFIMPSKKEGFGIVFIEAAACGVNVIAGNKDGSVEALDNGNFGLLIDPDNIEEISQSIVLSFKNTRTVAQKLVLQQAIIQKFGFKAYQQRLDTFLQTV